MRLSIVTQGIELSQLQLRGVFRRLGYSSPPHPEFDFPEHHCLALWTVMLVERLKFLAPEQRSLLCDELLPCITPELTTTIRKGDLQTPMVVIADSRYATWHTRTGWLDMSNGETVNHPRVKPLETLSYNLATLFTRNGVTCDALERRKGPEHEPASQS